MSNSMRDRLLHLIRNEYRRTVRVIKRAYTNHNNPNCKLALENAKKNKQYSLKALKLFDDRCNGGRLIVHMHNNGILPISQRAYH